MALTEIAQVEVLDWRSKGLTPGFSRVAPHFCGSCCHYQLNCAHMKYWLKGLILMEMEEGGRYRKKPSYFYF